MDQMFNPEGGHVEPIASIGYNACLKKLQNQALKNITSETINIITPYLSTIFTTGV